MSISKLGMNAVEHLGKYVSFGTKPLIEIKPNIALSTKDLKYVPKQQLTKDVVEISKEEAIKQFGSIEKLNRYNSDNFGEFEKYFMTSDGKYNKKALDIISELPDENGYVYDGLIEVIMKNLNIAKTDKNALLELRNIYSELSHKSAVHFRDGGKFFKYALNKDGSFDKKALEKVKAIIDKYKDTKSSSEKIITNLAFKNIEGIKSLDELSIPEKNELLTKLASNPFSQKTQNVYKDIEILPNSKEEYKSFMSKLIKETSIDVKALPLAQRHTAIKSLEGLTNADGKDISETIAKIYPEIRKIDNETVNILQKVMKDERFAQLPAEDKLTAQLAVILKDSSSIHGIKNAEQSAFNAFYLAEKIGLPHENKLKLYALVKNQNLYKDAEANNLTMALIEKAGCELRHENSYQMFEIINDAKGIQTASKSTVEAKLKEVNTDSLLRWKSDYEITQTKLPKASQFIINGDSVQKINKDGIENIVVYFDRKKPIMYKDETGAVKELKPEDVYNYCHATNNLQSVELASRPNSNYEMSSSFMNPTKGTHHMFGTEGVIVKIPKGNTFYEEIHADTDGTGFGKSGDATKFLGYWGKMQYNISDKCKEFGGKQISELSKESASELRKNLDSMLSNGLYGENISFHPEPIGVFFEGPYKSYSPLYNWDPKKNLEKHMGILDKAEQLACKLLRMEYKPKLYKIQEVPIEHRTYANEKDFAIFHLGY